MTLEEQLQAMAGTSAERQLIRRWMQRTPSPSSANGSEVPTTETDAVEPSPQTNVQERSAGQG